MSIEISGGLTCRAGQCPPPRSVSQEGSWQMVPVSRDEVTVDFLAPVPIYLVSKLSTALSTTVAYYKCHSVNLHLDLIPGQFIQFQMIRTTFCRPGPAPRRVRWSWCPGSLAQAWHGTGRAVPHHMPAGSTRLNSATFGWQRARANKPHWMSAGCCSTSTILAIFPGVTEGHDSRFDGQ